jgi:hypothetical protein
LVSGTKSAFIKCQLQKTILAGRALPVAAPCELQHYHAGRANGLAVVAQIQCESKIEAKLKAV